MEELQTLQRLNVLGDAVFSGKILATNETNSTSYDTGSIVTSGGMGVSKDIFVNGVFNAKNMSLIDVSGTTLGSHYFTNNTIWNIENKVGSGSAKSLDISESGLYINQSTSATSATTGALKVVGGISTQDTLRARGSIGVEDTSGSSVIVTSSTPSGGDSSIKNGVILSGKSGFVHDTSGNLYIGANTKYFGTRTTASQGGFMEISNTSADPLFDFSVLASGTEEGAQATTTTTTTTTTTPVKAVTIFNSTTYSYTLTGAPNTFQNGLYVMSASTNKGTEVAYNGFNTQTSPFWESDNLRYVNGTGVYAGAVSTVIEDVGTIAGEWIQIQLPYQIVLTSYQFRSVLTGGTNNTHTPAIHYLVGSNDGTTWYPLDSYSGGTTGYLLQNIGVGAYFYFTKSITNTTQYSYYRIVANKTNGFSNVAMAQIDISGNYITTTVTVNTDIGNLPSSLSIYQNGIVKVQRNTESSSITSGALQVAGGLGIMKNVNVGGAIAVWDGLNSGTIRQSGTNLVISGTNIKLNGDVQIAGNVQFTGGNVTFNGASIATSSESTTDYKVLDDCLIHTHVYNASNPTTTKTMLTSSYSLKDYSASTSIALTQNVLYLYAVNLVKGQNVKGVFFWSNSTNTTVRTSLYGSDGVLKVSLNTNQTITGNTMKYLPLTNSTWTVDATGFYYVGILATSTSTSIFGTVSNIYVNLGLSPIVGKLTLSAHQITSQTTMPTSLSGITANALTQVAYAGVYTDGV